MLHTNTPERRITTPEMERSTRDEMTGAILQLLQDGTETITEDDLRIRFGFTGREIAEHREAALAEARRRFTAARAAGRARKAEVRP